MVLVVPDHEATPPNQPEPGLRYFPGGERVAFFCFLVAVVGATAYMLWPILVGPLVGLAGGSLMHRWVARRTTPRARKLMAGLLTAGMVLVVLVPVLASAVWLVQAMMGELTGLSSRIDQLTVLFDALADRAGPLGPSLRELADELAAHLSNALPSVAQRLGDVVGALGSFLAQLAVGLVLACMTLYYTLVEGDAWRARFIAALPLDPKTADELLSHFHEVSVAVLVGGVGTSVVQTLVATLGYWLLGFEAPIFWGLVTGVASFVPVVGTALVYLPLALGQGIEAGWLQGCFVLAYGVLVTGTIDNLVHPLLVRTGMQIHPLLVFLAVFGGLATFGVLGLFLGPLLMATTVSALGLYDRTRS